MSEPKQSLKLLPIDDGVIVKTTGFYIGSTFLPDYNSTNQLLNKIKELLYREVPGVFYSNGIEAEILEPGNEWVTGKLRLKLVIEFIQNQPKTNGIVSEFISPLDDFRKQL